MSIKIILFLFCFIPNLYCMDLTDKKLQKKFQQKGLRKKIKKKKFYSIKCSKRGCTKKFERKSIAELIRPLVRHLYSYKHEPELYDEFYKRVAEKAYKVGKKWSIEYSKKKRFNARTVPALVSVVMAHEFATEQNNRGVFKEIRKHVDDKVKISYRYLNK